MLLQGKRKLFPLPQVSLQQPSGSTQFCITSEKPKDWGWDLAYHQVAALLPTPHLPLDLQDGQNPEYIYMKRNSQGSQKVSFHPFCQIQTKTFPVLKELNLSKVSVSSICLFLQEQICRQKQPKCLPLMKVLAMDLYCYRDSFANKLDYNSGCGM